MIRSIDDAQSDLSHLLDRIRASVQGGLGEFLRDYKELRAKLGKRSEASIIHDLIAGHLRVEFPDGNEDRVRVMVTKKNLFLVIIEDKYKIRVKKMRDGLRVSHIETTAVLRFMAQSPQTEMVPSPTNLFVGYKPKSPAELLTSAVWMVCPNGDKRPHWTMELLQSDADGASITPIEKEIERKPPLVTPKKRPAEGEDQTDGVVPDDGDEKQADGKDSDRAD